MSYLVVLIVDNKHNYPEILDAWEAIGVSGVTILESSGLGRLRQAGARDDLPLIPSLRDLFGQDELYNHTLLSVVPDQATVDRMVDCVQKVTGDLDQPNTGILFVLPVLRAYGLKWRETGNK